MHGAVAVSASLLHALYDSIGGIWTRMNGRRATAHEVSSRGAGGIIDWITDLTGDVAIVTRVGGFGMQFTTFFQEPDDGERGEGAYEDSRNEAGGERTAVEGFWGMEVWRWRFRRLGGGCGFGD